MKPLLVVLLLSALALSAAGEEPPPAASPPAEAPAAPDRSLSAGALQTIDERMDSYEQFRKLFEVAQFAEALPLAQRVVELSEAAANRESELPIAYNNLAATQYQLSDYAGAESNFKKSLALLEETQGISSRRLIVPLSGLGAVYAALNQHALAITQYDRALAVSRRSEGLFNLAQLPLIEQAAVSRFALNDFAGVERDHFYALRIAEQQYGFDDPRTIPAAMKLASFYESMQQFGAARGLYLRTRDISMKEHAGYSPMAVKSLLGIGRTYRLQYTVAPDSLGSQPLALDTGGGASTGNVYTQSRVTAPAADRSGMKPIEQALELLRAAPEAPQELLADALTELADWYQVTGRMDAGAPYYAEASTIYSAAPDPDSGNPLAAPRLVFYRAPLASTHAGSEAGNDIVIRQTQFSFDVDATGNTQNIAVVETDMADSQLAQARRALERALYSPRYEDGRPVATQGVQFTSRWYEVHKPDKPDKASTGS